MISVLKRFCLAALVAAAMTVVLLPVTGSAKVYHGTYEKNTKWTYDTKTKTVTIACQGRMKDVRCEGPGMGWRTWYLETERVVFKKGITYIAGGAFANYRKLKKVVLPEGLVSIGQSAFSDAWKLKKIDFPSTLKTIQRGAFEYSGLESISLCNVEKAGETAFSSTNIKSVTISARCKKPGDYVFWDCKKLKNVMIEEGITEISDGLFMECSLKTIVIPKSVTKIGKLAFCGTSLKESTLKRVKIKSTKIKQWGKNIFKYAREDLVIEIPKSKKKEYTKALRKGGLPSYVKIVGR